MQLWKEIIAALLIGSAIVFLALEMIQDRWPRNDPEGF